MASVAGGALETEEFFSLDIFSKIVRSKKEILQKPKLSLADKKHIEILDFFIELQFTSSPRFSSGSLRIIRGGRFGGGMDTGMNPNMDYTRMPTMDMLKSLFTRKREIEEKAACMVEELDSLKSEYASLTNEIESYSISFYRM